MCGGSTMTDDGRGRLISKYRNKMILGTNITDRPDEMKVLDTILFRMWQLGWLETMDRAERLERLRLESGDCNTCTISKSCRYVPGWGESVRINCPFFMSGEHEGTMQVKETTSKREKALRLLVQWAEECGFGYDNFPEEYERYKDEIEDMGYIEGMIHVAERVIEENAKDDNGGV